MVAISTSHSVPYSVLYGTVCLDSLVGSDRAATVPRPLYPMRVLYVLVVQVLNKYSTVPVVYYS
jgi:hypothetical protein